MLGFHLLGIVREQLGTQWVCLFQIFFFLNYVVIFVVWQLFLFNSCGLFLLPCQYFQLLVPLLQAVLTAQLSCTTVSGWPSKQENKPEVVCLPVSLPIFCMHWILGHRLFYNRQDAEGERGTHRSASSSSSRYKSHQGKGDEVGGEI